MRRRPLSRSLRRNEHDWKRCGVQQTHRDPAKAPTDKWSETVGANDDHLRVDPLSRLYQGFCDVLPVQQLRVNPHPGIA